jgi:RNA polymerase sigma-70 factor (ECF subfamily)
MTLPSPAGAPRDASGGLPPAALDVLVGAHDRFLSFIERRVGSRAVAEEILQEALARSLASGGELRDGEAVTAWFYRILRNAIVDHHRKRGAEARALAAYAAELQSVGASDAELAETICQCAVALLDTLRPTHALALRRVELDGQPLAAFAKEQGITAGNAAVRLHRARQALRERLRHCCHSCLDCSCA